MQNTNLDQASLRAPTDVSARRCVNCDAPLAGRFCTQCGEQAITDHDLTLAHFAEQAVETLLHADGKVFRTLKVLMTAPGRLTEEFMRGCRRPYLAPLSLFLIVNLLFFLGYRFLTLDALTPTLHNHLDFQPYAPLIRGLVQRRLAQLHETRAQFAPRFDEAAQTEAKSFVIIMVPLFALIVAALQAGRGRRALRHLVFATHFLTAWLIIVFLFLGIVQLVGLPLMFHGVLTERALGLYGSVPLIFLMALYLYPGFRTAYGENEAMSAIKAVSASLAMFFIVIELYKFALFYITMAFVEP